jgi:UDP-glucose 4-epimerase
MKRLLLTGATAFIGQHLCRRLLSENFSVTLLARKEIAGFSAGDGDLTVRLADVLDSGAVEKEVINAQPDAVLHLASCRLSSASLENHSLVLRTNSEGTFNLIAACKQLARAPKFIYASAMGVYDYDNPAYIPLDESHPTVPAEFYGLTKLLGEKCCEFVTAESDLSTIILRISGVFGPGKNSGLIYNCLQTARSGARITLKGASLKRDFVSVHDVVDALMQALRTPGDGRTTICNIGGGEPASLQDVVRIIEQIMNCRLNTEVLPETAKKDFFLDIAKARQVLGYSPLPLEQRIRDFASASLQKDGRQ